MNAEEQARREMELLEFPDRVRVQVRISWQESICKVAEDGDDFVEALFKVMTFGDNSIIEKVCSSKVEDEGGLKKTVYDFNEMKRLSLKRNLLWLSTGLPIEREDGWLTKKTYGQVRVLNGCLVNALLDKYWETFQISEDEEKIISRQSSILFSKNSKGVDDACEAVKLYCNLSSMNEKFGVTPEILRNLPLKDFMYLKKMVSYENDFTSRATSHPKSPTRIAGPGGKTRVSNGVVVPNSG